MCHCRSGARRSTDWAPASLAEAMMGILSDGSPLAHMQLGALSHHVAAVRHAMGALRRPGHLPAHLLLSDRDFNEHDYEALLALDDGVASRAGTNVLPPPQSDGREQGGWATDHPWKEAAMQQLLITLWLKH